jgi:hypothetical protein
MLLFLRYSESNQMVHASLGHRKSPREIVCREFEAEVWMEAWQDAALAAIVDVDPDALGSVLDQHPTALSCALTRSNMNGHAFYVLEDRLYPVDPVSMRNTLGSSFQFENEEHRERCAIWLHMVGAKKGDTLLHLCLRVNGADDHDKAACAVELLGRGASFETVNVDGEVSRYSPGGVVCVPLSPHFLSS